MELISVIVPVYNVERYLPKCLDSILCQSYTNLEILLINDGSTDMSGALCDEYARKDGRIKVFHQPNRGLAEVRNVGLANATGDYMSFVDSDDYIDRDFFLNLYNLLTVTDSDIVQCNYQVVNESGNLLDDRQPKAIDGEYTGYECLQNLYNEGFYPANVILWNRLSKVSLWKDISLPAGILHEDEYAFAYIYDRARKVTITSQVLYYYVMREDSITNTVNSEYMIKKQFDYNDICNDRYSFFQSKGYTELASRTIAMKALFAKRIVKGIKELNCCDKKKQELLSRIQRDIKKYLKVYLNDKGLRMSTKLRFIRYAIGIFD
ncbi:glycosyltransferase [Dysgonomonas sp. OttesenSCG-928-D17]|nr:glycosyltransferase [Dysgonomonas sp. OttesenSCG-928-D17]